MMKRNEEKPENTDLYLLSMPFSMPYMPSIALGILKSAAVSAGIRTKVFYTNLYMAHFLGIESYKNLSYIANSTNQFIETLFQPFAGYESYSSMEEIEIYLMRASDFSEGQVKSFVRMIESIRMKADQYLDEVTDRILDAGPKAVGASYLFQQANVILAVFKKIKARNPQIVTFIGGSSCSEYAGQALVDHMEQVDYVFCGESDDIFSEALGLMMNGDNETLRAKFPSVLQKGGIPQGHVMEDLNKIPYPDYDDYFEQVEELGLSECLEIELPFEASRGCWWGCKNKCRFCGLHFDKDMIAYRKKSADRVADELKYLRKRYNNRNFFFCDCILANEHIKELPPLLEQEDYRLYAEVKTNMGYEEFKGLRECGFRWFQPGIEAIQDDLLTSMNKGNRAIKHIEFLKWSRTFGIYIFWNIITGFPDEKKAWYDESMEYMRLIHHLIPPNRSRLVYQRNSLYTINHKDYGINVHPSEMYGYYFGKDPDFHNAFAEYFDADCKEQPYLEELDREIRLWSADFENGCILTYFDDGTYMGIYDGRGLTGEMRLVLDGLLRRLCAGSVSPVKISGLKEELIPEYSEDEIDKGIEELITEYKLMIRIKDEILFLALPRDVMRDNPMEDFAGRIR